MVERMTKLNPYKYGKRISCAVCGREKKPVGRSAPVALVLCDDECGGYYLDPHPGSLWPNESEADFGYPVGPTGTEIRLEFPS